MIRTLADLTYSSHWNKYKSALTLQWNINGCSRMKGTNTGDRAQHGGQSQAHLQPHGFTVNLGCPQQTSAVSPVSSVHFSGALKMQYLQSRTEGEGPMNPPTRWQTERQTPNTTNPPWVGARLLSAHPGITRHTAPFHLHQTRTLFCTSWNFEIFTLNPPIISSPGSQIVF